MTVDLISLAVIALVAALSPLIAQAIPSKPIPETVFLLIAGAALGPYAFGAVHLSESVGLFSDLGLAFLFLLAGYEINPKSLTGSQGKRGLFTWCISLVLAFLVVRLTPEFSVSHVDGIAVAIALTTTAMGTLIPILKERNLMKTRVGESILSYGTFGELGPVIAMALLLSARAKWQTVLILVVFVAIAILVARIPGKAKHAGSKVFEFLSSNANSTSQTIMRVTVLLLVGLVALSAAFNLDIVLGAFAAGFVLRYVIPTGNHNLEHKLEGIAYGFLIPIFFVYSGAKIDIAAVFMQPVLLIGFIIMLLVIRTIPILIALSTGKETRDMSPKHRLTVALYCTTALPIIVAVTAVAVKVGAMDQMTASVLVSAGAITVFLMPLLASITYRVADAQPIEAVREIKAHPHDIGAILREHRALQHMLTRQEATLRAATRTRSRANAFVVRHFPSATAPMQVWLPTEHADHALDVMNSPNIDVARWDETKRLGDLEWEAAKKDGDKTWAHLKDEGDRRWSAIKEAGDTAIDTQWPQRAAELQEQSVAVAALNEAHDVALRKIAAEDPTQAKRIARRYAREHNRRIAELQRSHHSEHAQRENEPRNNNEKDEGNGNSL